MPSIGTGSGPRNTSPADAALRYRCGGRILPWHRRSSYEPDAPARGVPQSPRWRVGLVCARMRNFLAGVILLHEPWIEVLPVPARMEAVFDQDRPEAMCPRRPIAPTRRLCQDRPDVGLAALVDHLVVGEPPLILVPKEALRKHGAAQEQAVDLKIKPSLQDFSDDVRPETVGDDRELGVGMAPPVLLQGHPDLLVDSLDRLAACPEREPEAEGVEVPVPDRDDLDLAGDFEFRAHHRPPVRLSPDPVDQEDDLILFFC